MSDASGSSGLFAALKNTSATLVDIAKTRLELLANELQVEKHRLIRQVALGFGLIFCIGLFLLLTVAFTTLLFWEQRLAVVAGFALLFAAVAGYCLVALRGSSAASEAPFATTLAELQKDLALLKAATGKAATGKAGDKA